ncbi:MAG: DUF3105 domain-containing protein [Dehalococcoidia bacterium]|nr:DUF3105 domain-containing protein [Dehalococcoidia bacterium]
MSTDSDRLERDDRREVRRQARAARQQIDTSRLRATRARRMALLGIPLLIVVAILAYAVFSSAKSSVDQRVGQEAPLEVAQHVPEGSPLEYKNSPPSSGVHYGVTRPLAVYSEEVNPGYWVHNLEHGGIAILYNCPEGCPDLVKKLNDEYRSFPNSKYGSVKLIVTPYSKLETRLAIVSWGWVDAMEEFDKDRMINFYRAHVDHGPEDLAM